MSLKTLGSVMEVKTVDCVRKGRDPSKRQVKVGRHRYMVEQTFGVQKNPTK